MHVMHCHSVPFTACWLLPKCHVRHCFISDAVADTAPHPVAMVAITALQAQAGAAPALLPPALPCWLRLPLPPPLPPPLPLPSRPLRSASGGSTSSGPAGQGSKPGSMHNKQHTAQAVAKDRRLLATCNGTHMVQRGFNLRRLPAYKLLPRSWLVPLAGPVTIQVSCPAI